MSFIDISNFVTVSVANPPAGLAQYQVNNLALFTKEVPVNGAITAANPGVYINPTDVATDWGVTSEAYAQAVLVFSQSPNILDGGGQLIIYPMAGGDTLAAVITSLITKIFFGGAIYGGYAPNDAELIAAAVTCEPLRVKLFASSHLTASLTTTTGVFWIITNTTDNHTRCLLYTQGALALNARAMAAAYAGRAMSTNFNGVATAQTMHGKTLVGITADSGISQTILNQMIAVGVDGYVAVGAGAQYLGKVYSTGFNKFFDDVANLDWLVFAVQVALANAIFTVGSKIPQTEPGMQILKNALLGVLQQAVTSGYVAPGSWNSPVLFGNPTDLRRNILNVGYYIYSVPVNQQAQAARVARQAPPIQVAIKLAGAIHSASVIVNVNP